MMDKPKAKSSKAEQELERVKGEFDAFEEQVKSLNLDAKSHAPIADVEPQTKLSQKEIDRAKEIYLKPAKTVSSKEPFNERFRDEYNFQKEYVRFIAENKECIGEKAELWTKPFPGCTCEFWQVPTNKPVWGPRYLAERIRGCTYSEMHMDTGRGIGEDTAATYMGQMVITKQKPRLTAEPVSEKRSVFIGASGF
jgi:hypothetical protein